MEISASACSSHYVELFQFRLQGAYKFVKSSEEAKGTRLFDRIIPRAALFLFPYMNPLSSCQGIFVLDDITFFSVVMFLFGRAQILEYLERAIFRLAPTCRCMT